MERDKRAAEKIEEAHRQIAKREQDERATVLNRDLDKELFKFNNTFKLIKERVLKEGGIENKFRLADKNGDGELSLREFYAIRD
jgi:Ca2+-binding EF-hand superfamily protein